MFVVVRRERRCKGCKEFFTPRSKNHIYHTKKCCFDYYTKNRKVDVDNGFPSFFCPRCHMTVKLTFSPLTEPLLWMKYRCACGYQNIDNDYDEIMEVIKELKNS